MIPAQLCEYDYWCWLWSILHGIKDFHICIQHFVFLAVSFFQSLSNEGTASYLGVKIYDKTINESKVCKYLGVYLDNHLNLQQNFEKVYKKASARVKLLSRIREQISPHVAESIYKTMI